MNWSEFFAMGGYGFYVWSAYGITALIIAWEIVSLIMQRRTQARQKLSLTTDEAAP